MFIQRAVPCKTPAAKRPLENPTSRSVREGEIRENRSCRQGCFSLKRSGLIGWVLRGQPGLRSGILSAPEETHPALELWQETPGAGFEDVRAPISKGSCLPHVAKGLSLSQLWRNVRQYLGCRVWSLTCSGMPLQVPWGTLC